MAAVEAVGGVVMINGERMIRREVGRAAVQSVVAAVSAELRERLMTTLVGDPSAEEKLMTELDESARRIEKGVADTLPVIH